MGHNNQFALRWAWIEMAKLSRPLSGVGGRFYYAWHMRTTAAHFSQQSPLKPLLKTRPLLAPGTEPAGLFVPVWPPAELWAVSLPTRQVDDLLKAVDLPYDQVQLLQGPSGRSDTQWALLPGVSEERRAEVQQRFYTQPYAAFVPYGVYKGQLNEASTVVEAWLKKKKRTAGAMSSLWRTVHFRLKALADSFLVLPDVQWDAPAKLRVALWTPGDAALFILKIVPQLLSAGLSLTDERTGAWIDEREVMSVQSGSSTYSVTGAVMRGQPDGAAEPIVLVDMPDHLLKQDVEAVVAMLCWRSLSLERRMRCWWQRSLIGEWVMSSCRPGRCLGLPTWRAACWVPCWISMSLGHMEEFNKQSCTL